jgi:hypothetical protein
MPRAILRASGEERTVIGDPLGKKRLGWRYWPTVYFYEYVYNPLRGWWNNLIDALTMCERCHQKPARLVVESPFGEVAACNECAVKLMWARPAKK